MRALSQYEVTTAMGGRLPPAFFLLLYVASPQMLPGWLSKRHMLRIHEPAIVNKLIIMVVKKSVANVQENRFIFLCLATNT